MSRWHRAPKGSSVDTSAQDDPAAAAVEVATKSAFEATSAEPAEVTALEATEVVPTEPDAKADDSAESVDGEESNTETTVGKRRIAWSRVFAYGVLPALVLLLALASGFFKWQDSSVRASQTASIEAVQTARDSTIKMLSYKPGTDQAQPVDATPEVRRVLWDVRRIGFARLPGVVRCGDDSGHRAGDCRSETCGGVCLRQSDGRRGPNGTH